jgi:ATP-dependent DNA helicase RecQ
MLTKPMSTPERKTGPAGEMAHDEGLFNRLRQLRKALADERDIPAYVVFSDVALRQMARDYPITEREFLQISGVGNRKLQEFGTIFMTEIANHMKAHPRQDFSKESNPLPIPTLLSKRKELSHTVQETLRMFRLGHSVEQIATQRGLVVGTIYGHLEQAIQAGESLDINRLITAEQQTQMASAFDQTGFGNLSGTKELLGDLYDYGQLRLFRALHGEKPHP